MNIRFVLLAAFLALFITGCVSVPPGPVYGQQSPTVEIVRQSGYTETQRRPVGDVRNRPYTTLGTAVKQANDVMVTVTVNYRPPRSSRQSGRFSNCRLHIKSPDSSLADVRSCNIEQAGNAFMVLFRTPEGQKSFDLRALGGRFDGPWPVVYTGTYFSYYSSVGGENSLRYYYVGPDPFR